MIANPKTSFEPHSSEQLPASKKVFVAGTIHTDVRVPMREIAVTDTKSYTGAVTPNNPVRVYDCSGPWGDPAFTGTSDKGRISRTIGAGGPPVRITTRSGQSHVQGS